MSFSLEMLQEPSQRTSNSINLLYNIKGSLSARRLVPKPLPSFRVLRDEHERGKSRLLTNLGEKVLCHNGNA